MTDNELVPTRQAIAAKDRSGKLTVSGKLKIALDAMLFAAASRPDAAKAAGMTDHSLRSAMRKAHVMAYYSYGLVVLRESERARNIKRLTEIRDKADNMPAVQAIKELELTPEQARAGQHGARAGWCIDLGGLPPPGLVIQINSPIEPPALVDVTPARTSHPLPSPPDRSPTQADLRAKPAVVRSRPHD
jgi:hypothetical protein